MLCLLTAILVKGSWRLQHNCIAPRADPNPAALYPHKLLHALNIVLRVLWQLLP